MDNLTEAQLLELFEDKSNFNDLVDYYILQYPQYIDLKIIFEDNDSESNYITIQGIYYEYGIIVKKDIKKAINLYQRAIDLNNSIAMTCLANYYEYCGYDIQYQSMIELLQRAVNLNNPNAMTHLAFHYDGCGIEEDIEYAIELYKRAVDLNDSDAMYNLAIHYTDGEFIKQDISKAIKLLQKAVDLNNSEAMNTLAFNYRFGKGVKKDVSKTIKLFQRAIKLNNKYAMNYLAFYYENGIGVKQNIKKAIELVQKAVDLNNPYAKNNLARYYENGIGVEQNFEKATDLYYKNEEKRKGDELCIQDLDIINKYNTEKQINAKLFEKYILLISKLDYEININVFQYLNEPVNTKEYFYDWLELRKMNKELEELNRRMNIEIEFFLVKMDIKYRPGGLGYEEAKKDFKSFVY